MTRSTTQQSGRQARVIQRGLTILALVIALIGLRPAVAPAVAQAQGGNTPTNLPVSFSAPQGGPCSVVGNASTNPDGTTSATVTITGAGQCDITASQAGNSQYNPATPITQSFTIAPVATGITLAPIAAADYNDPVALVATVSPTAVNGSQLTGGVTFSIDGTQVNQTPIPIDAAGHAGLTPTITQAPGPHQVTAVFTSSNPDFASSSTASPATLTVNPEDTTLTYTGDSTGEYHDPSTLAATLLEDGDSSRPLAGKSITFTLGSQSCSRITDSTGTATCTLPLTQDPRSVSAVSASFAGDTDYAGSGTGTQPFTATNEQTTVHSTGPTLIAQGQPVTLSGILAEDGTVPIAGRTLSFTLGSGSSAQSCSAPTGATGTARCTIGRVTQPSGTVPVSVSFAGDADYLASSDQTTQALIFAYPSTGAFVLGDSTAASAQSSGGSVTWWGSAWASANRLSGGSAPASFKGFASNVSATPPVCGGTWTASPGNSASPPGSVPAYMAVVVASKITQSGSTIHGNVTKIVIVQTTSGYGADPGQPGTGTIVATLCPSGSTVLRVSSAIADAVQRLVGGAASGSGRAPRAFAHAARRAHATQRHNRPAQHSAASHRVRLHRLPGLRHWKGLGLFRDKTNLLDQEIQFGSIPNHTYGDNPFTITAESVTTSTGGGGGGGSIPPDPSTVAPPNNPTVASNLFADTAFLYTGSNPIQTGVAPGTISVTRVSILKGTVNDQTGKPLSGVTVSVLDHPEYGQTISRADGGYDLAVNGGGVLTLNYSFNGYLPAQRQVTPSWDDYAQVDPVDLVPFDSHVTTLSFSSSSTGFQEAQSSTQTDSDGSRQETLLVPPGTTATMHMPDGSSQPLAAGHLRLTEFTVGDNGPQRMPASLPPTSAYTYCFAVSLDEEEQAGASDVTFSQPVVAYNQNFLGWPVGAIVPIGEYDDSTGQWAADPNGLVIKILDHSGANGEADLAVDSSGQAATAAEYQGLGITDAERAQLASMYPDGTSLWRFTFTHDQATFDPNGGTQPTLLDRAFEAITNALEPKNPNTGNQDPNSSGGQGTLDLQRQTMSEDRPVSGTPFTLHYGSDRQVGFTAANTLQIPIPGTGIPNVDHVEVHLQVAGRDLVIHNAPFDGAVASCCATMSWDGLDAYGRPVNGVVNATITVVYIQRQTQEFIRLLAPLVAVRDRAAVRRTARHLRDQQVCSQCLLGPPAFGLQPQGQGGATLAVGHIGAVPAFQISYPIKIGHFDAQSEGLGGWTLSAHHSYDPTGQILSMGDGTTVSAQNLTNIITRIAGTGTAGDSGDGGSALQAQIDAGNGSAGEPGPGAMTAGPDGSIYFVQYGQVITVRKIAPNGIITTIAGGGPGNGDPNGTADPSCATDALGDGCPATDAALQDPRALAFGPDGSLYLVDSFEQVVRRITPDGIIHLVAGVVGSGGYNGDGIPATSAQLFNPDGLAVGPDGAIYVADYFNNRIREIGTDGLISTVAGTGRPTNGFCNVTNGQPATSEPCVLQPSAVAVAPDGSVYFVNGACSILDKIDPTGLISNVTAPCGIPPTGTTPVSQTGFGTIAAAPNLLIDRFGDIYLESHGGICNNDIYEVTPDGDVHRLAGVLLPPIGPCPEQSPTGDGGPATQAGLDTFLMAVAPDGSIYESDETAIRKISAPLPGLGHDGYLIPSPNGSQLYGFDAAGKQLSTYDALTGQVLLTFGYDPTTGYLDSITDANGNQTTIQRNADGTITITAPFGQVTTLATDSNGYLASISDPLHETTGLTMDSGGLLQSITGPNGNTFTESYDSEGLLTGTTDPGGGGWSIQGGQGALIGINGNLQVSRETTATSAGGRTSTLQETTLDTGTQLFQTTFPDGTIDTRSLDVSENNTITDPAGDVTSTTLTADPRLGVAAPLARSQTMKTPSGLTETSSTTREVTLNDPTNPLTLTGETTSTTFNGNTFTNTYTANSAPSTGGTSADTSPLGRMVTTTIDGQDRPTSSQVGNLAPISLSYDNRGRLASETWGTGTEARATTYSYGSDGRLAAITDPANRVASYTYDPAGHLLTASVPGQGTVQYSYDADGNLLSLTTPGGKTWSYQYDGLDRVTAITPPSAGNGNPAIALTYDADRQLTGVTRSDGQTITYTYSSSTGQLTGVSIPQGSYSESYNAATGQLTGIIAPGGVTTSYGYDGSLPTGASWSGPVNGSVSRGYDSFFRPASDTVAGGSQVSYGYDSDGLITAAGDLSITHDPTNGLVTGTTLGGVGTTASYDDFGEVASSMASANGGTLLAETYSRDNLGRITSKTETIGGATDTYTYTYDPQSGRLTQVQKDTTPVESYAYDADGNRTSGAVNGVTSAATYDAQGELTRYGNTSYTYDVAGNRASKTDSRGTTSYSYDPLGNLRQVTLPDSTQITYLIDGLGQRIGKEVGNTLVAGYLYDQQGRIVALLDGTNAVRSQFVYAPGATTPSYLIAGGTEFRIISDQTGSPRVVVNASSGQIVEEIDYDSFGNQTISNVAQGWDTTLMPFGFGGGLADSDTGLILRGARDYDPQTGSWTARDPLGFGGGDTTLYAYALGDPVNVIDPSGAGPHTDSSQYVYVPAPGSDSGAVTMSAGVSASYSSGGVYASEGVGIAADTEGNAALYFNYAGGKSVGTQGASVTGNLGVYQGSVDNGAFSGQSYVAGGSGGIGGLTGGLEVSKSGDQTGVTGSLGVGEGVEGHVGTSTTLTLTIPNGGLTMPSAGGSNTPVYLPVPPNSLSER